MARGTKVTIGATLFGVALGLVAVFAPDVYGIDMAWVVILVATIMAATGFYVIRRHSAALTKAPKPEE